MELWLRIKRLKLVNYIDDVEVVLYSKKILKIVDKKHYSIEEYSWNKELNKWEYVEGSRKIETCNSCSSYLDFEMQFMYCPGYGKLSLFERDSSKYWDLKELNKIIKRAKKTKE